MELNIRRSGNVHNNRGALGNVLECEINATIILVVVCIAQLRSIDGEHLLHRGVVALKRDKTLAILELLTIERRIGAVLIDGLIRPIKHQAIATIRLVVLVDDVAVVLIARRSNAVAHFARLRKRIQLIRKRVEIACLSAVIRIILAINVLEEVNLVEQSTVLSVLARVPITLGFHHRLAPVISIPIGNGTGDLRGVVIASGVSRSRFADPSAFVPSANGSLPRQVAAVTNAHVGDRTVDSSHRKHGAAVDRTELGTKTNGAKAETSANTIIGPALFEWIHGKLATDHGKALRLSGI